MRLGGLIKKVVSIAKEFGGKATIYHDASRARLVVRKNAAMASMLLPEDLYAEWNKSDAT